MKTIILFLAFLMVCCVLEAGAQNSNQLRVLKSGSFPVHFSQGHEGRARSIQARIGKAMEYFEELVDFHPDITVMVLNEEDWKEHTTIPMVYGMPHYTENNQRLFLTATDNPFWKSFIPPVNLLPADLAKAITSAYRNDKGELSMQSFFDLLALHELSHAFQFQAGLNVQRKWMGEVFANIFLHTYIAAEEPEMLSALTVFPKMVIESGSKEYSYTTLDELEKNYVLIATKHPKNYGWFQSRWHTAAADVYNEGGVESTKKLWKALRLEKKNLNDDEFLTYLKSSDLAEVAAIMENWTKNTR
ncbi:MAG: hypothetical protein EOO01_02460 [Chitinophagaceae bacterium]|nr:MAG: hypothetical protein EOO01_02460 [Chitinophagaceae bacterium]